MGFRRDEKTKITGTSEVEDLLIFLRGNFLIALNIRLKPVIWLMIKTLAQIACQRHMTFLSNKRTLLKKDNKCLSEKKPDNTLRKCFYSPILRR